VTVYKTEAMQTSTFEVSLLVGYDAALLGNWFQTFRDVSLVPKCLVPINQWRGVTPRNDGYLRYTAAKT